MTEAKFGTNTQINWSKESVHKFLIVGIALVKYIHRRFLGVSSKFPTAPLYNLPALPSLALDGQ